jgi:phosphoglycerate dehydrogenase-like enzyme
MTDSRKVLVAVSRFHESSPEAFARLRAAGCEVVQNDLGRLLTEDELIERLPGVFATIAGSEPYTERVLAAAPDLRVIARFGVGYDQVDIAAASRHGVAVAMAFGTNHEAVADHAFALIAALGNRILLDHQKVMGGGWGSTLHLSLWRSTVGIVGLGRIGRALARRCRGFEMRVLACDAKPDPAHAREHGIELVELEMLLRESDFVSIHAPHAPETDKLIDRDRLALMKPGAYLINTARGGLVDEAALYEALAAKRIAGAGLDVFEIEPLPAGSPLRELDNVILTPHVADLNAASLVAATERCVENVLAIKDGRSPSEEYLLNPEAIGR